VFDKARSQIKNPEKKKKRRQPKEPVLSTETATTKESESSTVPDEPSSQENSSGVFSFLGSVSQNVASIRDNVMKNNY